MSKIVFGPSQQYIDEIEKLEKALAAKDAEIAELRRTSGEPVAWLIKRNDGIGFYCIGHDSMMEYKALGYEVLPLYLAPPPLELPSQEEIETLLYEGHDNFWSNEKTANALLELLKKGK